MASSEGTTSSETLAKEPETLATKVDETLAANVEETVATNGQGATEPSCYNEGTSSPPGDENPEKTLQNAAELMERGSMAIKDSDFTEATECFSRALEIRVTHYGELAPECASAYYKYGCALLYKAQEEADPLGTMPRKEADCQHTSDKDGIVKNTKSSECSTTSVAIDAKQDVDLIQNEGESPDDIARAIVEKQSSDTIEKVDILSALGEVALEREDIETSLSDYLKALSILERLVEPDSRHIAELICLCLEIGSKAEEAIPYCQKAISVCKVRLQRLMDEVKSSSGSAATSSLSDCDQKINQSSSGPLSDLSVSDKEVEIETLTGLSGELEKKLEDLQQLVLNPTSIFLEALKMVPAKEMSGEKSATPTVMRSSQMGIASSSGNFDSPTVSTAHTNGSGGVTHLGVIGRGVKRASVNSDSTESTPMKKPELDSSAGKGEDSAP
ncbi:hypothetical protein HHK36_030852 [Tetracentron sinense]|uniref:Uncharacterized protein n=1 Tax=Tetracentron sinense TaxID=13715 RepID=A0A835D1Y0_TETSI|nr:hypothetical protein HHK36_030852 [Tetracentron sinense]